jgi:hypothetical protein
MAAQYSKTTRTKFANNTRLSYTILNCFMGVFLTILHQKVNDSAVFMPQLKIIYTNIVWYVNKTPAPSTRIFGKFFSLCLKY